MEGKRPILQIRTGSNLEPSVSGLSTVEFKTIYRLCKTILRLYCKNNKNVQDFAQTDFFTKKGVYGTTRKICRDSRDRWQVVLSHFVAV